jgi:hypothetical protein
VSAVPNGNGNGDSVGVRWGDKGLSVRGPLALAVLIVGLFGGVMYYAIRDAATAAREAGREIAASTHANTERITAAIRESDRKSRMQYERLSNNQRMANCLQSYDTKARQRLRERAEQGKLNLDAWCRWMDAVNEEHEW